jgi:3-hydroxyisobutyrate dehydrogenase
MTPEGAVGFVGLGNIGRPMAERLTAWPGGLWVYDVVPEAVAVLESKGAKAATSVAQLAEQCSVVSVMVRDDEQVHQVLSELLPAARNGTVVAVHSTVGPETPSRLAQLAASNDVHVLDAPVSGGPMGAAEGRLAIMCGGGAEAFDLAREPLQLMGEIVELLGPVGAGTRAKLARNLLHFVSFTAVGEAQRLAEAADIDLEALGRVVRHTDAITGGPGAIMLRPTAAPMADDDPWRGIFEHVRVLGEKDLAFATDLARSLGVDTPLADRALTDLAHSLGLTEE